MKKKLFYFLIAIAFISIAGCKNSNNEKIKDKEKTEVPERKPADGNKSTGGFSIDAPDGWTKTDTTSMGYRTLMMMSEVEGPEDIFRENINVVTEKTGGMSFENYMSLTDQNFNKMLTNYKEYERKDIKVDGVPAKSIDYSHSMGVYNLDVNAVLFIKDGTAYVITSSAEKGKIGKWRKEIDATVASFHTN
jgi:hypothetical protein